MKFKFPIPEVRGNIARTYLYMDAAYPGRGVISRKNQKLFDAWNKHDPVDGWECERAKRIEKIQGNVNPFVKQVCDDNGLWWNSLSNTHHLIRRLVIPFFKYLEFDEICAIGKLQI